MMVLKKKTIIIITLVLLIVAAGYISTKYGRVIKVDNDKKKNEEVSQNSDAVASNNQIAAGFFIDVKIGRENERASSKQTLNDIIESDNTSKEAKDKAANELLELVNNSETEMVAEALIKSLGYEDALVLINNSQVDVTVKAKSINEDQVSKIKNIVCRETKLPASKITVQPRE